MCRVTGIGGKKKRDDENFILRKVLFKLKKSYEL